MYIQMIVPGVDEYLARGIKNLGDTLSLFFKTDRRTQRAIRDMLIQNPDMIQRFSDLERNAPGSLERLGFGNIANIPRGVPESVESELSRTTREPTIRAGKAKAEIGVRGAEGALDILKREAGLDEDFSRSILGLPSRSQELVSERQGQVAEVSTQALENLPTDMQSMQTYVDAFINEKDDPKVTSSILSDPQLSEQFKLLFQKRLLEIRETSANIPADIQNRIAAINPARQAFSEYATKVRAFMKHPLHQRIAVANAPEAVVRAMGLGSLLEELGEIKSMQSGLMGTFRPILSPGPLSRADIAMLKDMLGSVTSIRTLISGESYVEGQLRGAESFLDTTIEGIRDLYPGSFPSEDISYLTEETPLSIQSPQSSQPTQGQSQFQLQSTTTMPSDVTSTRTDIARRPNTRGAGITPRTGNVKVSGVDIPIELLDSLQIRYPSNTRKVIEELRKKGYNIR